MATIKGVVLGDKGSGKTTLFQSYIALSKGKDLAELSIADKAEVPEATDTYAVMKMVGADMYFLNLFNISGQESNEEAMKLVYLNSSVFIICFSVSNKAGLASIREKWLPAIKDNCPDAPFLLVGTKSDTRDDSENSVTKEEGEAAAGELGALKYLECCANTQDGVEEVFDDAFDAGKTRASPSDVLGLGKGDIGMPAAAAVPGPKPHKKKDAPAAPAPQEVAPAADAQPQEKEPAAEVVPEQKAEVKEEVEGEPKEDKKEGKKDKKAKGKKKGCTIL